MTVQLSSNQRKFLREKAHDLRPLVSVGKEGVTDNVIQALEDALNAHELIKVRFVADNKEKERKAEICEQLSQKTGSAVAGRVGHIAIFYRPAPKTEDRTIKLPKK